MIEIRGISKTFGDNPVLKDISATFEKGKVNMIIGQSGSGKTVIAKCIVGLMEVDQGAILYDGQDFVKLDKQQRMDIRRKIGFLFQYSALFDSMTVEENVMFPMKMFTEMTKEEMLDRVNFCLKRVNMGDKNALYPSELSGGMQKRVGIARAISLNPAYLFCDEPNSGLDPRTSIVIDNLIKEITEEFNMTTVVISHDMNSVIEIGQNINFLFQGQLWWKGDKKGLITTDNEEVNKFVYSSEFMQLLKEKLASSFK
ncbi:MAG TPA: ATP-binding cassette domain-containing protein [Flavobacteriales bacterium]|nr:ATP-binding cassette domain-containing protein [Flavobacteriales bacterium]